MDPNTIGSIAASALALANETVKQSGGGAAIKDAYVPLRDLVAKWADENIRALEVKPDSFKDRSRLANVINAQPTLEQNAVFQLTESLIRALQTEPDIRLEDIDLNGLMSELGQVDFNIPSIGSVISRTGNVVIKGFPKGIEPTDPWPEPGKKR